MEDRIQNDGGSTSRELSSKTTGCQKAQKVQQIMYARGDKDRSSCEAQQRIGRHGRSLQSPLLGDVQTLQLRSREDSNDAPSKS